MRESVLHHTEVVDRGEEGGEEGGVGKEEEEGVGKEEEEGGEEEGEEEREEEDQLHLGTFIHM